MNKLPLEWFDFPSRLTATEILIRNLHRNSVSQEVIDTQNLILPTLRYIFIMELKNYHDSKNKL